MFTSLLAIIFLFACNTVAAPAPGPLPTTPLAKRIDFDKLQDFVANDKARARHLNDQFKSTNARKRQGSTPATNEAVTYVASVGVGTPPTYYDLIVDTGSSNTWIGAGTAYNETPTSVSTGDSVVVEYGSGFFEGNEYFDTVTLSPTLVVVNQSLGVAYYAYGFNGVDGILGLGPVDLTSGTVGAGDEVPTVVDNLFTQGEIPAKIVGVYFQPTTTSSSTNGELTYGGVDSSKFTGDITYTPVTSTSPASAYWGIDQSVTYGGSTILSNDAGIVDTGTTLIYLATDAYNAYVSATGASLSSSVGLLQLTAAQYAALEPLNFVIGGATFALSPNAQLWPRSLNTYIGGTADAYYLVVSDIGSNSGEGLDFIDGLTFLERFYSVYDTDNSRIGFATTAYTNATTN